MSSRFAKWMPCAADNKHFKLVVNGKEYPSKIGTCCV